MSNAYRLLPMHPLWQIKQVINIGGMRRVDRCCYFGSRSSPDLWCTFMSLVLWISIHVCGIEGLLAYMDDNFAFDPEPELHFYEPYNTFFPHKQVAVLDLWDYLNIPHTCAKQLYDRTLTIIGFSVDSDLMVISLPTESTDLLVSAIRDFVNNASGRRFWSAHDEGLGFMANRPVAPDAVEDNIFWYEALTVLSALRWSASLPERFSRVAIFTDNLNTVQMFDSFRSREPYTFILLAAIEILIEHHIDLCVWHIPGEQNIIADALSRQLLSVIAQYAPWLHISSFEPPHVTSGLPI
ncbi:hypothetical protein BDY19DRAFT_903634 [Irpex rosettiformis]|uniref:Uncharacterized protein n=1 Tax=Irpex rosettiformis TaxID=378272 RepID=A0ACB8UF62_9APHY|nr:hypothetical protein BDY19DRAFT_903634 [Irpex rosettiformis]